MSVTYPCFLFATSTFYSDTEAWLENPNWRVSMHFSIALLNSKMWMLLLLLVHATKDKVGWNMISLMSALLLPLFNSYTQSPPSVLNSFMMCPLLLAEAIRVPSGFTAKAPISVSCAGISKSMLLSTTDRKQNNDMDGTNTYRSSEP